MRELIIIGGGPAGITASIYAARKRMDFLVLTRNIGGRAALGSEIENYTGYQYISGAELVRKFEEHMRDFSVEVRHEEVKNVGQIEGGFMVRGLEEHRAKSVIVATGARPRMLNVPGEREFLNRGVTYCATCDAPLFSGRDVAVIGGGNSGLDAVLQLTRIANRIYLIERGDRLRGDEARVEKVMASSMVDVMTDTEVLEISGEKFVSGIRVSRGGKEEFLKVQGVFIEVGHVPNSDIVRDIVKLNELGEIVVDFRCRTSAEGIFAAGDVTNVPQKQIIVAAGEGAKAAISAHEYLQMLG
ncbi:MAG: FAD-dependent oxidoreductase [Candidatus Hadarchaeales archaeon]